MSERALLKEILDRIKGRAVSQIATIGPITDTDTHDIVAAPGVGKRLVIHQMSTTSVNPSGSPNDPQDWHFLDSIEGVGRFHRLVVDATALLGQMHFGEGTWVLTENAALQLVVSYTGTTHSTVVYEVIDA